MVFLWVCLAIFLVFTWIEGGLLVPILSVLPFLAIEGICVSSWGEGHTVGVALGLLVLEAVIWAPWWIRQNAMREPNIYRLLRESKRRMDG